MDRKWFGTCWFIATMQTSCTYMAGEPCNATNKQQFITNRKLWSLVLYRSVVIYSSFGFQCEVWPGNGWIMISKLLWTMQLIFYWYFFMALEKDRAINFNSLGGGWAWIRGAHCTCVCLRVPGAFKNTWWWVDNDHSFHPGEARTEPAFTSPTPTSNAEDVEGLRLLHLPVQLPATHVGPVLQRCLEALAGRERPANGLAAALLVQGDADVWVGDHAGDRALHAGLGHHSMGALHEPHLRICTQRGFTWSQATWKSNYWS